MAKAKTKHHMLLDWDGSQWVASVSKIPGCHTQGRSIRQVRERMRWAIAAALDLPKKFDGELTHTVIVGKVDFTEEIEQLLADFDKLHEQERKLDEALRRFAAKSKKQGLATRDTAELLGVSHQTIANWWNQGRAKTV